LLSQPPTIVGLHHACVYAADFDLSVRFYVEGLGCQLRHEWSEAVSPIGLRFIGRGVLLSAGPSNYIEIFPIKKDSGPQEFTHRGTNHFSFRADDCDRLYDRAISAGGRPFPVDVGEIRRDGFPSAWDGRPITLSLRGTTSCEVRVAYLKGPDGEIIELLQSSDI
jgi:catechol 2,3-dioxygenase-like lactoylglutathione lyase family enzyme